MSAAIRKGYLDQSKGTFRNPLNGEVMTIPEAVTKGLVIAEVTRATEQTQVTKILINASLIEKFN